MNICPRYSRPCIAANTTLAKTAHSAYSPAGPTLLSESTEARNVSVLNLPICVTWWTCYTSHRFKNPIYLWAKWCHGFCRCSVGIDRVCWATSYCHQSNSVRSAVWRTQNDTDIKLCCCCCCCCVLAYSIASLIPYDQLFVELKPLLCTHIFSINKCSLFWIFVFSFFSYRPIPLTCNRSLQLKYRRNSRHDIKLLYRHVYLAESPLHSGDRQLRRSGGAYPYQATGNDVTLEWRYVHLSTRATSIQSFVQGDKHLGLPDTNIHGVAEQTCPDMPFLCKTHGRYIVCLALEPHAKQSLMTFLSGVMRVFRWLRTLPPDAWSLIQTTQTPTIPPADSTSEKCVRCMAYLRYQTVRRHRTSNSDTLPFPYHPRSDGDWLYQNVRLQTCS